MGTHTAAINYLSTWTAAEKKTLLGLKNDNRVRTPTLLDESNLTDSVNWVTAGAVTQLRTRDNADHAGLSLPLVLWKVLTSWPPRTSFHFPSSNWSIAQPRTLDAMVDSWTMLSNMPSQTK